MNFSATISLRMPAQKNGLNTVRLQVILNRQVIPIPLGFAWPELLFDKAAGKCLSKPAGKRTAAIDKQLDALKGALGDDPARKAADYNLVIGQALGQANEIAIRYRLSKQPLTRDEFLRDYNSGSSKEDFLDYMETRINERYRQGQIVELTYKSHYSTLNKLKEFVACSKKRIKGKITRKTFIDTSEARLPFHTITHRLSTDFDSWLKTAVGSCQNTRVRRHRSVKAYLELARRDKIQFENPYQYFSSSPVAGKWKPLTEAELLLFEQHYTKLEPGSTLRRMLQKFLFSCHCGLRLGDLKQMGIVTVVGQRLELQPHKTYRYDEKDLYLPVTKKAMSYLNDSQTENKCQGFRLYADQYTNRKLQALAQQIGVKTKVHHHIGRETFATNFSRKGGKVEVLQKLLGHKKLSMTMKYVHVDEDMKKAEIDKMDELDGQ